MNVLRNFVKNHPLLVFFALTYLFSWFPWPLYNAGLFPMQIFPPGPLIAAAIVTPIVGGRQGLKDWASRIVRWRVGLRWYVAAIFLPLLIILSAVVLNILLGAPVPTADQLAIWPTLISEAVFVFILVALGEEPGFRGFALPRLQSNRTALIATLILAAAGVVWHLPLFFTGDSPWTNIPLIVAGYFILTWMFNNTNGSVLLVMIMHTAVNIFGPNYFATMFSGADRVRYDWLLAGAYCVAALILIATSGYTRLSQQPTNRLDKIVEPMQVG